LYSSRARSHAQPRSPRLPERLTTDDGIAPPVLEQRAFPLSCRPESMPSSSSRLMIPARFRELFSACSQPLQQSPSARRRVPRIVMTIEGSSLERGRTRDRRSWILGCPPVVVPFKILERISRDSAKLRRALADLWGGFVSATISFSFESLGTCLETRSSHSVQRMPAESILGNGKIAMPRYSVAYVPRTPGVIPGVRRGDF